MTFEFDGNSETEPSDECDIYNHLSETENTGFFVADSSLFRKTSDVHLAEMLKTSDGMDGYDLISNASTMPFDESNMIKMLLQNRGLRIAFSEETLNHIPNVLGVKMHPEDKAIYQHILRDYQDIPTEFISRFTNGEIDASSLDPMQRMHQITKEEAVALFSFSGKHELSSMQINDLIKRAFMTSRLIDHVNEARMYERMDENERAWIRQLNSVPIFLVRNRQNMEWYEALRNAGYEPLGSEELFGIMNGLVSDILEWSPGIANELRKRQSDEF